MGDSDDEFERRRRDKFRGERADYGNGNIGASRDRRDEGGRRRDDWGGDSHSSFRGRDSWSGHDRGSSRRDFSNNREYGGRTRDRYSPGRQDMSPPVKRRRGEWEERRYPAYEANYGSYPSYGHEYGSQGGHGPPPPSGGVPNRFDEVGPTQPPMMSFKAFMEQCDDAISEEEALSKYSEYKLEFKRQQLNEFFVSHKEEEWFKAKYHPEEYAKRKAEQIDNLKRRVAVYEELDKSGIFNNVTIDADQSDQLLKLLDSVVIKLEGGSDLDLQILDQPPEEETKGTLLPLSFGTEEKMSVTVADDSNEVNGKSDNTEKDPLQKAKELLKQKSTEVPDGESRKRKRSDSGSSSSDSGSDSEEEPPAPGLEDEKEPPPPGMEEDKPAKEEGEMKEDDDCQITGTEDAPDGKMDDTSKDDNVKMDEGPKPRPLHKTASIFLRNLAPTITKQEVEQMCRRYNGFLRAAIADPQPERRWFRRGWVTFKRDVNIKDICWNLNNIRLRDCELGAIVNRDLSRRIRTVNGITSHKAVVKSDIKLAAKIIQNLDTRWNMWNEGNPDEPQPVVSLSNSANPALKGITDYLIEEASAEEEELLGAATDDGSQKSQEKSEGENIERVEALIKVLDRLLFYLRMVHSVDYYNHSEYPNEDEMPNRCGIMHARGIPPSSKVTPVEINDYCKAFENKIGSFLQPLTKLTMEDAKKLGAKEATEEVDKFVNSNTQELNKEKFGCPLCGKKFKASAFVHKHITIKHAEKVAEVEKEVEYFNNYLRDPKRPQLPEYPGNKASARKDEFRPDPYVASYPQQNPSYGAYGNYGVARYGGPGYGGGGYGNNYPKEFYNREQYPRGEPYQRPRAAYRSRSGETREVIGYQDLDVPEDIDLF